VIEIADLPVHPPRERDSWLMQELTRLNYSSKDLHLNRVQLHQEILFLSTVIDASGWALNRRYLRQISWGEKWFTLSFPTEQPPPHDFKFWKEAIPQIRALAGASIWEIMCNRGT
jgi:hypothetical protein